MRTDSLLDQPSGHRALAPLPRDTRECPPSTRRPPFDTTTISLHWATVVLVLAMFASAWLHVLAEDRQGDFTPLLLQIHRSFGVIVWIVTALRLAWRRTSARLPPFPAHMTRQHRTLVQSSEYGLYALLLSQPLTGLLATLTRGRPFDLLFWRFAPLMSRNETLQGLFHSAHELGAWVLAAAVLGHTAVALFHHFVLRDDVLACMAPVIAMPSPGRNGALRALFPTEAHAGNKREPSAVLPT